MKSEEITISKIKEWVKTLIEKNEEELRKTVIAKAKEDELKFDQKSVEFRKCGIENCQNYETNQDTEMKYFCQNHWIGYASK